jgi:phosphoserine phosphatase RsbU/P
MAGMSPPDGPSSSGPVTVLVADDEPVSRLVVAAMLRKAGHEVVEAADGAQAWTLLQGPDAPQMAVLDWMMPGLDGTEVCRRVRERPTTTPPYLILLTSRAETHDIVEALKAGANDHVRKPANEAELLARVQVGVRILQLQAELSDRVTRLEAALHKVQQLQRLLPICAYCKRIRDDGNYWQQVESYIADHAGLQFSHSVCPDCYERVVRPELDAMDSEEPGS